MTSRLHPSGLQGKHNLKPDLTTLGKYIGGGLAIGAFGGRESLLAVYDPRRPTSLPHSGTFNNNTLAMTCGYVGLTEIYTDEAALELNALGDYLREELQAASAGTQMVATGVGAVLTIHFLANGQVPKNASDLESNSIADLKKLLWYWCLERGFWITERGMLSIILGTTKDEVDAILSAVRSFLTEYSHLVKLA
jgi:glutamate-1-semialdehyde 2,1-aminomutase